MKRSVAVTLVLMGGSALAACSDSSVETAVFKSVEECVTSTSYTIDQCKADYNAALASHKETAPAYDRKIDCEIEFGFGKCEELKPATTAQAQAGQQRSHSIFLPLMAGYMMGSMFSNGKQMPPQALYRQSGGSSYVNANGAKVARGSGPARFSSGSSVVREPKKRTTTYARGGFGSRASAAS